MSSDLRTSALQALAEADRAEMVLELLIEDMEPDPNQPRQVFDPDTLAELAASMRRQGQLELVKVRVNPNPAGPPYMLVDGERRWRMAKEAGFERLRAVLDPGDTDPGAVLDRQFALNVQRDNMTLMEQARYLARKRGMGLTLEQLAEHTGLSLARISKILAAGAAGGAAGEARDAGLTKDADTLTGLQQLERLDPAAAASIVDDAKAKKIKIGRDKVKEHLSEAKQKAGKGKAAGKGAKSKGKGGQGAQGGVASRGSAGSWEAPRGDDDGDQYRTVSLANDGPAKVREAVTVDLDWVGDDADQRTLWESMIRHNGPARLCMVAGTDVAGHALVEFGKDGKTEAFPLDGLRITGVHYAA